MKTPKDTKNRYSIMDSDEGEFEPGSHNRVLRNKLHINKRKEIERLETEYSEKTLNILIDQYNIDHQFIAEDICYMHKLWLGKIYPWAGNYRTVNMSKGGFPFAAATEISRLMENFQKNELQKYTPCCFTNIDQIVEAIAIVHSELVLIHPFREGNGRLSRKLSILMALQARLPILNFSSLKGRQKLKYFSAVQSAMSRDYQPIKEVFKKIIDDTLSLYA